jgi:DNA primase
MDAVFQVFVRISTGLKNCPLSGFSFSPLYRGETEKLGCVTAHDLLAKRKSTMNLLDLISSDTTLSRVAGTRGGEYTGACPWCGGRDRFRVWPDAARPRYWCRQCGRKGDAVQYLRDRHGLTYRDARARLGLALPDASRQRLTPKPPPLAKPPSVPWQAKAQAFTTACEQALWTSAGVTALAYLHHRGLHDDIIRAARIGYHAATTWEQPEPSGFASDHKKLWLPPGIVFPWWVGNALWRVVIRRVGADVAKEQRYVAVSGGSNTLYRVDTLRPHTPAMVVEGCLDALAIAQEAGDLIAVVAAGSTTGGRLERWIGQLALASRVLVAFDADDAGEQAAVWWLNVLGTRAKRWRPYWDDPNAMLQDGVDLRTWVREGLGTEPLWWREVATWPEERQELWAERAAILEIDGGLPWDEAERQAFEAVRSPQRAMSAMPWSPGRPCIRPWPLSATSKIDSSAPDGMAPVVAAHLLKHVTAAKAASPIGPLPRSDQSARSSATSHASRFSTKSNISASGVN